MIEVEVSYEQADYVRAIRFMSRRATRIGNGIMLVFGIVFALVLYRADPFEFRWWIGPAVIALLVLWYCLMMFIRSWNIGRQLRKAPAAQGTHVWVVGKDGIKISGALSTADLKWQAISKVRESKDDFFFYTAPRFAQFLPKRSLAGEHDIVTLRNLITDMVGVKAKIT